MTMSLQNSDGHIRGAGRGGMVPFIRRALGGKRALAAALLALLAWRAVVSHGGTPDPTDPGSHLGHGAVLVDSAILVLREGLETILVLAAVTASFRGERGRLRRPVAAGGAVAFAATVATWFIAIGITAAVGAASLDLQAATGLLAIVVLLLVMNWFFHKVYWTGWIAHHHKRRRRLLADVGQATARRTLLGFALLGFTSVYREGFEVVLFLQNLRLRYGSGVVLEGVAIGLVCVAVVGTATFVLHRHLPYKKMLVATGVLLGVVLLVMVGESVKEMQQAGWIATTPIAGVNPPGWLGLWFSVFANWQTIGAQVLAAAIVIGSYVAAERRIHRRSEVQRASTEVKLAYPPVDESGDAVHDQTTRAGATPQLPVAAHDSAAPYRSAFARRSQVGHRYGRAALGGRRPAGA
jgi:high-affinity iron transporter